MSGTKFAAFASIAFAIQASDLWTINGWNATHGIINIIAATLIVGSLVAWQAQSTD